MSSNEIFYILQHATPEEKTELCRDPVNTTLCKLADRQYKEFLQDHVNFGDGLVFIESVYPGYIFSCQFKKKVEGYLTINTDGKVYNYAKDDDEFTVFMPNPEENSGKVYRWDKKEKIHRDDGKPAIINHDFDGNVIGELWFRNGKFFRDGDEPSVILYDNEGNVDEKAWYKNQKYHRIGGPARVVFLNGMYKEEWYKNGVLHNRDGPCTVMYDLDRNVVFEEWKVNGKFRDNAIAERSYFTDTHGVKDELYIRDGLYRHVEYYHNGNIARDEYYKDSESSDLHREDGPAITEYDEDGDITLEEWYLNDRPIPKVPLLTLEEGMADTNTHHTRIRPREA